MVALIARRPLRWFPCYSLGNVLKRIPSKPIIETSLIVSNPIISRISAVALFITCFLRDQASVRTSYACLAIEDDLLPLPFRLKIVPYPYLVSENWTYLEIRDQIDWGIVVDLTRGGWWHWGFCLVLSIHVVHGHLRGQMWLGVSNRWCTAP